jgi:hypothetical protein
MIKNAKLALIFVLVVLFSGCTDTESTSTSINADGVLFDVYANTLQPQLYEGQSFSFQVIAENNGGYTIPASHLNLFLGGVSSETYSVTPEDFEKQNTLELTSIGIYNAETTIRGQEVFSFEDLCYKTDLSSDLDVKFHLKACYDYQTNAKTNACFGEAYSQFNEICVVTEQKTVTNTVAPIQVTEIYESSAGQDSYRFIVKVENKGTGAVFAHYASAELSSNDLTNTITDSIASCRDLNPSDSNVVYIDSIKLDGVEQLALTTFQLETYRENEHISSIEDGKGMFFNLVNGKGQFIFKISDVTATEEIDFVGNLEIVLGYGYTETKIRNTELVSLPDIVPNCQ